MWPSLRGSATLGSSSPVCPVHHVQRGYVGGMWVLYFLISYFLFIEMVSQDMCERQTGIFEPVNKITLRPHFHMETGGGIAPVRSELSCQGMVAICFAVMNAVAVCR